MLKLADKPYQGWVKARTGSSPVMKSGHRFKMLFQM